MSNGVKEVAVEVIKEVTLVREVLKEVVKEVKVKDEAGLKRLNTRIATLEKSLKLATVKNKDLSKKLAAKPKTFIKEVPVEVIREVEVVKEIDFNSLEKMMGGMKTVEISKKVIGEIRTKKEGKVVSRREVKAGATKAPSKTAKIPAAKKAAPVKKATAKKGSQ